MNAPIFGLTMGHPSSQAERMPAVKGREAWKGIEKSYLDPHENLHFKYCTLQLSYFRLWQKERKEPFGT